MIHFECLIRHPKFSVNLQNSSRLQATVQCFHDTPEGQNVTIRIVTEQSIKKRRLPRRIWLFLMTILEIFCSKIKNLVIGCTENTYIYILTSKVAKVFFDSNNMLSKIWGWFICVDGNAMPINAHKSVEAPALAWV